MRIANYEDTGLEKIVQWIIRSNINTLDTKIAKEVLKTINISFVIEEIDRIQSTLLCELKDSYVQQSQRYVVMSDDSYILPQLSEEDTIKAKKLIEKAFKLYEDMSELKEGSFKGRPKAENYKYGIPIEDARYILPLATKTNLSVTMSGDKLWNLFELINDKKYYNIFKEFRQEIVKYLPNTLVDLLPNTYDSDINKELIEDFYRVDMNRISYDNNVILFNSFKSLDIKVGLGALTSTLGEAPSKKLESWGEAAQDKARNVAQRVLGYGHDSIAEQARATFGMMCSMVTYHQQIRHRLSQNYREDMLNIITDIKRPVVVPSTIESSLFHDSYYQLVNEFKNFRLYLLDKYGYDNALPFILNCDQIKFITSTNARADISMLSERICLNAQWEIRELSTKKLTILRQLSAILYEKALPSCVYGKCKEGKLTCGKQVEVKNKFLKD